MPMRQIGASRTNIEPETAVVTGASSGIGKVYADRLAQRGYDLVLVARRRDKLEAVAEELRARYGIRVDAVIADLAEPAALDAFAQSIASNDRITLLVNNAGVSKAGALADADWADLEGMIRVNIMALSRLSSAVLPRFKARDHGTIVNIGSVAGFHTQPGTAFYSATKAFILNFTRGLQAEAVNTGITIQLVAPAATESGIWDLAGLPLSSLNPTTVMSAEDCVDASLRGLDLGEAITLPSLQDPRLLERNEAAGLKLLQVSQTTGRAAARYASSTA